MTYFNFILNFVNINGTSSSWLNKVDANLSSESTLTSDCLGYWEKSRHVKNPDEQNM
jgi:hypothetical protein